MVATCKHIRQYFKPPAAYLFPGVFSLNLPLMKAPALLICGYCRLRRNRWLTWKERTTNDPH